MGIVQRLDEELREDLKTRPRDRFGTLRDLADLKRALAQDGLGSESVPASAPSTHPPFTLDMVKHFIAGYYDLDLRDVVDSGHGRLLLDWMGKETRETWEHVLSRGELVGIASSEPQGGSFIRGIQTEARPASSGSWLLSGEKSWISRLSEAILFVVFFRFSGEDALSAVVIPASSEGIERNLKEPMGLRGWTWGTLKLENVPFEQNQLLGRPGDGLHIFRDHFERYRPLVACTVIGAAASVHDHVTRLLVAKSKAGRSIRDSAYELVGLAFTELRAAFLACLATNGESARPQHRRASPRLLKALAVDTAIRVTDGLSVLSGASAYELSGKICKTQRDLRGFVFADGVQDALLRAGGRALLQETAIPEGD